MLIKYVYCDLDGTLTNGCYSISTNVYQYTNQYKFNTCSYILSKDFNTRDFMGLKLLLDQGIEVGIITNSSDECIDHKLSSWKSISRIQLFKGVEDKKSCVNLSHGWEAVAFIGDDIYDIELLSLVGLAACPNDAHISVKRCIEKRDFGDGYILENKGGDGAVREFADLILDKSYFNFLDKNHE